MGKDAGCCPVETRGSATLKIQWRAKTTPAYESRPAAPARNLERAKGVEPSSSAWEAEVMPLYDARSDAELYQQPNALRGLAMNEGRTSPALRNRGRAETA